MSLARLNHPCGLTFKDWQDVYHTVEDGAEIGSHVRDLIGNEVDCHYLDLEAMTRGLLPTGEVMHKCSKVHQEILKARGVGNWRDPKVVLLVLRMDHPLKTGSPWWDAALPCYDRIRPFSGSKKGRKFLWHLLTGAGLTVDNVYITSVEKPWFNRPLLEEVCLKDEFRGLNYKKIIALGHDTAEEFKKRSRLECLTVSRPEVWDNWHGLAWNEYRERFRRLSV